MISITKGESSAATSKMIASRPRSKREIDEVIPQNNDLKMKKKDRKKPIPWMKLSNLPIEIIELIFTYCGTLSYWTFRIFREYVRFREYLDPRYLVLTNLLKHQTMFRIPPGQDEESHTFITMENFEYNFHSHCEKYNIKTKSLFLFLEIEILTERQEEILQQIMLFLKNNEIKFSIFLRALCDFRIGHPTLAKLFSPEYFKNSDEIIVDKVLIKCFQAWSNDIKDRNPRAKFHDRLKFFEYPSSINIREGNTDMAYKILDLNNVSKKSSTINLQHLYITRVPNSLLEIDLRIFKNLTILSLNDRGTSGKKSTFKGLSMLNLKSLSFSGCNLARFSNNNLPMLECLTIHDKGLHSERQTLKLKMFQNSMKTLKSLKLLVNEVDFVHLNEFGDQLESFYFHSRLDDGGSSDIPLIVSRSQSVNLKVIGDNTMKNVFSNIVHDSKIMKKLFIEDDNSYQLDYLEGENFKSLEILTLKSLGTTITEINSLIMPKLKGLTLLNTSVQTVKIQNSPRLEKLIFTSTTRAGDGPNSPPNSWSWLVRPTYFVIDLTKVPTRIKPVNINLNFFKADKYQTEIPSNIEPFLLRDESERLAIEI